MPLLLPLPWVSHAVWNIIFLGFFLLPPRLLPYFPIDVAKVSGFILPTLLFQFLLLLNYLFHILHLLSILHQFSSVQSLSCVQQLVTPWTAARRASLSITNSWSLLKLMSIESVMPSNHIILCRPLLLLPPIFPSIRVFSNESALHIRWPKFWCFSFNISPFNEHPGLISFRMDWLDLLAVQGTLKSLFQYHSSKHQFFGAQLSSVQLSHP